MFYLMMIPVTLMSLMMLIHLIGLTKHDCILYRFCDIRRTLMKLLRDEGFELDRENYIAIRELIEVLNIAINNYNSRKTVIFNYRRFMRYWKQYERTIQASALIQAKDEPINQIRKQVALAMLKAFIAYTPLIRSEIIVHVFRVLGRVGLRHLSRYADKLSDVTNLVQQQKQWLL